MPGPKYPRCMKASPALCCAGVIGFGVNLRRAGRQSFVLSRALQDSRTLSSSLLFRERIAPFRPRWEYDPSATDHQSPCSARRRRAWSRGSLPFQCPRIDRDRYKSSSVFCRPHYDEDHQERYRPGQVLEALPDLRQRELGWLIGIGCFVHRPLATFRTENFVAPWLRAYLTAASFVLKRRGRYGFASGTRSR